MDFCKSFSKDLLDFFSTSKAREIETLELQENWNYNHKRTSYYTEHHYIVEYAEITPNTLYELWLRCDLNEHLEGFFTLMKRPQYSHKIGAISVGQPALEQANGVYYYGLETGAIQIVACASYLRVWITNRPWLSPKKNI